MHLFGHFCRLFIDVDDIKLNETDFLLICRFEIVFLPS